MSAEQDMDCADARDLFPELDDDGLEGWRREALLEHVRTCASCREALADHRRALLALRDSVPPRMPEPVVEGILRAVDQASRPQAGPRSPRDEALAYRRALHAAAQLRPPSALRRVAVVALATLLGAAATLMLVWSLELEPRRRALPASPPRVASRGPQVPPGQPSVPRRPAARPRPVRRALARPSPVVAAALAVPSGSRAAPGMALVVRDGPVLELRVSGSVREVVPTLLNLLDREDEELVALVSARLEDLRAEVQALPGVGPALERELASGDGGHSWWSRLFRDEPSAAPQPSLSERWMQWWSVAEPLLPEDPAEGAA